MKNKKSYCECTKCGNCYLVMIPGDLCPKCEKPVEPQEVEPW